MMRASLIITALLISVTTAWDKSLEFDDCWGINYADEDQSYKLVWDGDHKTSTCKVTFHGYDQSEVLDKYKICIRATTWDITHDGVTMKYFSDEDVLTDNIQKEFNRYSYDKPTTEWCSDAEDYVDVQLTTTSYDDNQGSITLEIYAQMTFDYSKVVGAIVGGVIGGIALISIIITVIVVVSCRRRRGQGGTVLSNNQNTAGITTVPQYGQPPMQGGQGYNTAYNAPPPAYNAAPNYSYPAAPPPQGYATPYSEPVPYQQTTTQPTTGVHQQQKS